MLTNKGKYDTVQRKVCTLVVIHVRSSPCGDMLATLAHFENLITVG